MMRAMDKYCDAMWQQYSFTHAPRKKFPRNKQCAIRSANYAAR